MATMTCYYCFAQFHPTEVFFRCPVHPGGRFLFPYRRRSWWSEWGAPRKAVCPEDLLVTGFRVCPNPQCHADLPYFVGRTRQRIIAVTGCGGTGKTVYLWSLLHRMREELSRDRWPFAVTMFEDDASFATYQAFCRRILHERRVPDFTDAQVIRESNRIPPVIARVMTGGAVANLVLYDPAGELFENLSDKCYLRYLAGATAIIYLTELPSDLDDADGDAWAVRAADGLTAVVGAIRGELEDRLEAAEKIPKPLAIVVTKSDETLFAEGAEGWVAGLGRGQDFWRNGRHDLDEVSTRVEGTLANRGFSSLIAMARNNFPVVRYFAISSLGHAPRMGVLRREPCPVGVENPLYWTLKTIR